MKVLHFSALDGQTGAGIAAARIHNGLLARGIDSRFCAAHPSAGLKNAFTPPLGVAGRIARKARRMLDDRMMRAAMRGYDYVLSSGACGFDIGRIVAREKPDIVQLHWIGGNSFRLTSLAGLRTPVVWRLSDQWPFCGLQHLEPDAGRYRKAPPKTPSLIRPWTDLSEHVRYRKLKTYQQIANLTLACPSRWLAAEARRSALFQGRPIELIPTSCDTEVFAPRERDTCREVLGLPLDKTLVLVGATSMGTAWKGADLFGEAMAAVGRGIDGGSVQIVTFGQEAFEGAVLEGLASVRHMGPVRDRRLMSILYNAADVFAAPSRMENLANTVLESLSCGTPVVAFDIGGMPDMIDHGVNGFLAPAFNTGELADGIRWALAQRRNDAVRHAARRKILEDFSPAQETDKYIALYDRVRNGRD